jgi:hypothetical protein
MTTVATKTHVFPGFTPKSLGITWVKRHGKRCRPEVELAGLHGLLARLRKDAAFDYKRSASVMSALLIWRARVA